MRRGRPITLGSTVLLLLCAGGAVAARARDDFPHARHERVFPVCQGCHVGVVSGMAAEVFPTPADCARCHDGTRRRRVDWQPPAPRVSNLSFSHVRHLATTDSDGEPSDCQSCHAADSSGRRMNVGGPRPALCIGCHAHRAENHTALEARCDGCHLPLTSATALDSARIARFPRPDWHRASDFLSRHGGIARSSTVSCAVCHARESCERCHANAERVPAIVSLGRDARVASLTRGKEARYPEPDTHRARDWNAMHGTAARVDASRCANCHTRTGCVACHQSAGSESGTMIATLPLARLGGAPGVSAARMASGVHPPDILRRHGPMATAGQPQCAECHAPRWCTECHAAQDSRAFHPANFSERHAADAFAGSGDCQSCHRTETFCRGCHSRVGIASNGKMNAAFHTAQGSWVLSHGQAARRGLETCAACHAQSDCLRCHSATGGWGVNPHGADFDAKRSSSRSAAACRVCHTTIPLDGK